MHRCLMPMWGCLLLAVLAVWGCSDSPGLAQLGAGDKDTPGNDGDLDFELEIPDSPDGNDDLDSETDGDLDEMDSEFGEENPEAEEPDRESEFEPEQETEFDVEHEDEVEAEDEPDAEAEAESETPSRIIAVLTINLLNPLNPPSLDGDQRAQIVADFINAVQPDFVTSQEVVQSAIMLNRAQFIADRTGYFWVWHMTHDVPYVFQEGISILSKWPILWEEHAQLPHEEFGGLTGDMFTRSVMGIEAEIPGGNLNVFCSHMTISLDQIKKADQAAAILTFMDGYPSEHASFFSGDLNAEPNTLAMMLLRGESSYNGMQGNLQDAWLVANGADPGFTSTSDNPTKRIDYIYMRPAVEKHAEVLDCELVFTEAVDGLWPSDHLGILCRFRVE